MDLKNLTIQNIWLRLRFSSYFRDVAMVSLGTGIGQATLLISAPVLTRLYSPQDFGVFAIFTTSHMLLTLFITCKFEQAIVLEDTHHNALNLCYLVMVFGGAVAFVFTLFFLFFRNEILSWSGNSEFGFILLCLPLFSWLGGMAITGYYWSHRLKRFDRAGTSAMASKLAQSVASIILGLIPLRLPQGVGLMIGFAVGSAFQSGLTLPLRPKKLEKVFGQPFRLGITSAVRRHWRLCFSLVGSQGLSLLAGNAIVYAIGAIYGDVRLGLFALATRMVAAPSKLISKSIGDVYRQRAARQYQLRGRFDDLMLTTFNKTLSIAIVPDLLAMILVVPIFSFVFGQEWTEAGEYARVLLVSGLFSFILTPLDKAALIIGAKAYILLWHAVRLTGVISIFAAAFYFNLHIMTCLWIYALLQISLYIFDFFYELRLAKGLHPSSIQVMSKVSHSKGRSVDTQKPSFFQKT